MAPVPGEFPGDRDGKQLETIEVQMDRVVADGVGVVLAERIGGGLEAEVAAAGF